MSTTDTPRVRRYWNGEEHRLAVSMGHGEHGLTPAHATVLRDALTRELGTVQALTDREAMVWAAAFVGKLLAGRGRVEAARQAAAAVSDLRKAASAPELEHADPDARAMLVAMTGGGR